MPAPTTSSRARDSKRPNGGDPSGTQLLEHVELDHAVDVFKALGHPVRLEIMRRMMNVPELACLELEHTLPIAKATISYHIKILYRAGLINVRKVGRYYHYTPRRDEMDRILPGLVAFLQHRVG